MDASPSPTTLKKSFSRRVSFKEDTIVSSKDERDGVDIESRRRPADIFRRCIFSVWLSVVFGIALFLMCVAFAVTVFYVIFNSKLPIFRVVRLDVGVIDVGATEIETVATVTANLAVTLEGTNGDGEAELLYRNMNASVVASGVNLGTVGLADMRQPPRNTTRMVVAAAVKDMVMENRSANDLQRNAEAHVLMIDVSVKGWMARKKRGNLQFTIECRNINQSAVDAGKAPRCKTQETTSFL